MDIIALKTGNDVFDSQKVYRKAWTAYVPECVSIAGCAASALMTAINAENPGLLFLLFFLVTIFSIISIFNKKSITLSADSKGIFITSGIFPWSSGTNYIRWRDVDSATFSATASSYFTKSYNVVIKHRFTKTSEISVSHVKDGKTAVELLNEAHELAIKSGLCDLGSARAIGG